MFWVGGGRKRRIGWGRRLRGGSGAFWGCVSGSYFLGGGWRFGFVFGRWGESVLFGWIRGFVGSVWVRAVLSEW